MDPIADLLITIKNGYMAKKSSVTAPYSKFRLAVAQVLEKEKFVGKVEKIDERTLNINLVYENDKPGITFVKKVSKLGLRVYSKSKSLKQVKGGRGLTIVSTPQGVMTGKEAKTKKLGGEIICQVW
jgi:small subunit ribosomal protein S8